MKIKTTRFGELEISEDAIITFPEGLLGFAEYKRYVLLDSPELEPLHWLQSIDAPWLAFVVLDPRIATDEYEVYVSAECAQELKVESPEDVVLLGIVTAAEVPSECTINLQAPLVINRRNRLAKQIILMDQKYPIRHPLLPLDPEEPASDAANHQNA